MDNVKIQKLRVIYDGYDEIFIYFDNERVLYFPFSLVMDCLSRITEFLLNYINGRSNKSEFDIEGDYVYFLIEDTEFDANIVKFSVYKGCDFDDGTYKIKKIHSLQSMYGDRKQVVAAIYFSLMKMIASRLLGGGFDGYVAERYGNKEKNEDSDEEDTFELEALILYNKCKSIEIENYIYPELTKLNRTKSEIEWIYINTAKSFQYSSDVKTPLDLLEYRKKIPPTEELFYQPLTDCTQIEMTDSLIMILPTEKVKNKLQEIEDGKYKPHLTLQVC
ncbi:MAG: hypothetical protein J6T60_06735 [Bacteroidales bacterium]|nr:hypothetical protein [Bacteroidales bacterium]